MMKARSKFKKRYVLGDSELDYDGLKQKRLLIDEQLIYLVQLANIPLGKYRLILELIR